MLALTLRQPYASAVFRLGKDVENRSWKTPHRGVIAIHAGLSVIDDAPPWMESALRSRVPRGVVLGVVELRDIVVDASSEWARVREGMFHWLLHEPRELGSPVSCTGRQGLFTLPEEVAARVSEQL